jgi:hypothetical protein
MDNLLASAMIVGAILALTATLLGIEVLRLLARKRTGDAMPRRLTFQEAIQCLQDGALIPAALSFSLRSLDFQLQPLSPDERVLMAIGGLTVAWLAASALWRRLQSKRQRA